MSQKMLRVIAQSIIWLCLAVILFSPLYLNSHLFFPFIVTKTIAFNIAVAVMFLAFLFLALKNSDYKIRLNLTVILMAVYIAVIFMASLLGNNFYRSFWSNNERSEGILLLLHLFLFLTVLTGFFRKLKEWLYVFDLFFFSSFLVALIAFGQYLNIPWLFASTGGQRLAGTIGNAGYMAGFLFFSIFFGLLLLFKRNNIYLRIYYGLVILLESFIVLYTDTRGGILALFISGLLFVLYLLFFYFRGDKSAAAKNKKLFLAGWLILALALIFSTWLFLNSGSDLVKNSRVLARMASIASESVTAQNRLMTWGSAWQGFKERPILGWGYENFYQPFDQYYNPKIFRHAGSVIWYDRAHDIIFDRLITGGLIGFLSYFALLLLPFYYLWRKYRQKQGDSKRYFIPVIFTLIIFGYLIQNLFIFEALVTYIPLFLVIGFVGVFGRHYEWKFLENKNFKIALLAVFIIAFTPILYLVNIKPLKANIDLTKAISAPNLTFDQRIDLFESVLARQTNGNQEYRRQLFNFFQDAASAKDVDQPTLARLAGLVEKENKKQIAENPYSVTNYLVEMRFNNMMFNLTGNINYINNNPSLFAKAKELAPNRQHIYFEIGYTNFYLANYLKQNNQTDSADANYKLAIEAFAKALDLNDQNLEPYRQLANILVVAGDSRQLNDLLARLELMKNKYNPADFLTQLINVAISAKSYNSIELLANKLIALDPNNPQYYVQAAMAYAYMGNNDQAIEMAQKVAAFGPDYKKQSDDFIKKVKSGEFKK